MPHIFLGLFVVVSHAALTTSVLTHALHLRPFEHLLHNFCLFKLFNSPIDSVCWWCNSKENSLRYCLFTATQQPPEMLRVLQTNTSWSIVYDAILLISSAKDKKKFQVCRTIFESFIQFAFNNMEITQVLKCQVITKLHKKRLKSVIVDRKSE